MPAAGIALYRSRLARFGHLCPVFLNRSLCGCFLLNGILLSLDCLRHYFDSFCRLFNLLDRFLSRSFIRILLPVHRKPFLFVSREDHLRYILPLACVHGIDNGIDGEISAHELESACHAATKTAECGEIRRRT